MMFLMESLETRGTERNSPKRTIDQKITLVEKCFDTPNSSVLPEQKIPENSHFRNLSPLSDFE